MQVELNVTQENIDANGQNFNSPDKCPISVAIRDILHEGAYVRVHYDGIEISDKPVDVRSCTISYEDIPFTNDVPDAYRNHYKHLLTPFTTMLDIPEQFLRV